MAKKEKFVLTPEIVRKVIETVDAGLSSGMGSPKPGHMCVEAAVCYALGMPHGDSPTCVSPILRYLKINLNDSKWSSKQVRTAGLRRLAVLQLGTRNTLDNHLFMKKVVLMNINTILPVALFDDNLPVHAERCAAAKTLEEGIEACFAASPAIIPSEAVRAVRAAGSAARAISETTGCAAFDNRAAAGDAARAISEAVRAASYSAKSAISDKILKIYAVGIENILIEMEVPAVQYLRLLDK